MSILIKGMEMPKGCKDCLIKDFDYYDYCPLLHRTVEHCGDERLPDCPLIEIPPHGRLIDGDALKEFTVRKARIEGEYGDATWAKPYAYFACLVEAQDTVIEAEE